MTQLERVQNLLKRISTKLFDVEFRIVAEYDKEFTTMVDGLPHGRIYLQVQYEQACNDTGEILTWHGGKFYLSQYMTDDEIVKKAWVAFEMCVKHEVMEAFLVDGLRLFNPHADFEALLSVSKNEVKR